MSARVMIFRNGNKLPQTLGQYYMYGVPIQHDYDLATVPTAAEFARTVARLQKQIDRLKEQLVKLRNRPGTK